MAVFSSLVFLSAVTLFPTVHALNACPSADTVFTGTSGIRYRICPNTDLTGGSQEILRNVASVTACAQRCDTAMNCFQAVYDTQTKDCHFKAFAGLNWVDNGRYDVIQAEQINIARCPYNEATYTNNGVSPYHTIEINNPDIILQKTFKICRDTDIRGPSKQMFNGVTALNDCAQRCSTIDTCVQAVYDATGQICHIKADARTATGIWSTDKRFDVIRLYVPPAPAANGAWSDLIRLPVIPVAAYVVPENPTAQRLLVFSSWGADSFGGEGGRTQFADYNFNSGAVSPRTVADTKHDMFCPAISSLQDGRILIQGGSDAAKTSFYDPKTNAFSAGPDMEMARGYQTSVTLSDNRIFTIGGAYSGPRRSKDGEVYDPASNRWTALPDAKVAPMLTTDAEGIWREDNHAWLFAWKNGSVFQAGPSKAMNWYGTSGLGTQTAAGIRDPIDDAMCGTFVMYEPGKILSAGGSPDYTNSDANARAHITTINNPNAQATVERVPDMAYPRGFANAVVLPDSTVLVTGGQRRSMVFTDDDGVLYAELFNPTTKTWKTLAPEAVPRNYHSVSILLSDGRVFSGGGGLCYIGRVGASSVNCNKLVDHADGQIFSPPYLFNPNGTPATRPVISTLSSTTVKVGGQLIVGIGTGADDLKFALVRIGSVTHSVNSDQRRVPLTRISRSEAQYYVTLPSDSGVLIPGAYYLFAINAQGVPSIARTVQILL
ncbi:similar to galactose oxidase precursor [Plenodomus lingam JN3]|uniref:Similar to galactose oxidase n=1 Tax=Leptosphaeria maculans (strain JN3 / isolate v23.1.3 / race Av1-4-5-6-7-8) TaxID=985895 RepID=E5A991_LEPMJ|nr:similar to galactose oxidase precursor [Plenodomus lingam JN3]CBY00232.1 similar to galactose oxidase precursor [Plenodomus lingam JN3]